MRTLRGRYSIKILKMCTDAVVHYLSNKRSRISAHQIDLELHLVLWNSCACPSRERKVQEERDKKWKKCLMLGSMRTVWGKVLTLFAIKRKHGHWARGNNVFPHHASQYKQENGCFNQTTLQCKILCDIKKTESGNDPPIERGFPKWNVSWFDYSQMAESIFVRQRFTEIEHKGGRPRTDMMDVNINILSAVIQGDCHSSIWKLADEQHIPRMSIQHILTKELRMMHVCSMRIPHFLQANEMECHCSVCLENQAQISHDAIKISTCQQFLDSLKLLILDMKEEEELIKKREVWTKAWIKRRQRLVAPNTWAK